MTHEVGISEMKVVNTPDDILFTRSLGSCIGVSVYDAEAGVGGMLHFQLPLSKSNPEKAALRPCMYGDTGITALLTAAYDMGASRDRIVVKIAGGAAMADKNGYFNIGKKNIVVAKKFFWKNRLMVDGEDTGGDCWRNMRLEMNTGRVIIKTKGRETEI